jgi:4-oxalocrotonate tautomerase
VIVQLTVGEHPRRDAEEGSSMPPSPPTCKSEPGLKPDDIFVNLVEVKREDWSFGGGIAQYVA